jgi:tyrosine-protein phosphatase SIW14
MAFLVLAGHAPTSTLVWAVSAAAPGVPNFHQVNERVYRGGQPNGEGWGSLARLGVKTVIDLRQESERSYKAEELAVESAGMHYVNVPLNGVHAPSDAKIRKALSLLDNSADPVFVHCRRGADRTGTVIACYRIAHDGWSNRKALQEAMSFGMRWIDFGMRRYVLAFRSAPPQLPSEPAKLH